MKFLLVYKLCMKYLLPITPSSPSASFSISISYSPFSVYRMKNVYNHFVKFQSQFVGNEAFNVRISQSHLSVKVNIAYQRYYSHYHNAKCNQQTRHWWNMKKTKHWLNANATPFISFWCVCVCVLCGFFYFISSASFAFSTPLTKTYFNLNTLNHANSNCIRTHFIRYTNTKYPIGK